MTLGVLRFALVLGLFGFVALANVAAPAAAPLSCDGACTITATSEGFLPPAVLVSTGASVSWISLDTSHANADGLTGHACFDQLGFSKISASTPIRFDISGGMLLGTVGSGVATPCAATPLVDGTFALPYYCIIHPVMRGVLLVR